VVYWKVSNTPTTDELREHGWFIDATSDDIDFSTPDGSPEHPYPVELS
jgi:hypothetical protein